MIFHFDMDAVRMTSRCDRPFDLSKLIYIHCIDLGTKKYTTVTSFPCLELCCVLGHFSFPRELAVRRLCCVLWRDDCKAKLLTARSPVLINVKSSCYFTVTIFVVVFISYLCRTSCISLVFLRRLRYTKQTRLKHVVILVGLVNVVQLKLSCVNLNFFWLIQESDGSQVTFIVDLEAVGKVQASKT